MKKIHLGCGEIYLDDWINIDFESEKADLKHDLTKPLPFENNTIDFIYSEHLIEHLTVQDGLALMKECRRILKPEGVIRIATPNVDYLLFRYFFFWKWRFWYRKYGYTWIKTRAEMVNICFREWGHQYLYNRQELKRRLKEAGFKTIYRQKFKKSRYPELRGKETRRESKVILEALKS